MRIVANPQQENPYLQEEISSRHHIEEIVGISPAIRKVLNLVEKVAQADTTVLISGETGTGKELFARALHGRSPRAKGPLISVSCAALSEGLIESELSGHERGAFIGAVSRKIGRFELADGGTLFLDEIGDLPPEIQVKLLRVLQEREFERVGGNESIRVDVRVITATNRNLEEAVEKGRFRSDFYYRLNVFPIHLPPLRERKEDIPPSSSTTSSTSTPDAPAGVSKGSHARFSHDSNAITGRATSASWRTSWSVSSSYP